MAKIDDSVKKKVPELRFKGFTDEWEERKFADFIDVKSGKDYKHLNSGSIPVYGTGGYMLSVDRALSDIDAIGIGRKGTIDKPYLLKAPFWTVDTLFYAVPKQNIDLQFSLSIFKKINWKKFDESTGVPSLSKTVINSVSVSVPSYEEQQKIGSFFKQLDDTIALHQRKLDLLKETKKGFLQKMFPKNGAKVPELRFAGFADDWEERKLGDLATSFEYGLNASAKSFDGTHKYIRITDIDDSSRKFNSQSLTSPDIDLSSADNHKLKNGDILFARTGASVGKTYIYADSDGLVYYAGFLIRARIKSGVDSNFVFQHTLTSSYENFIRVTSQRSGQPGVNAKEYSTFEISVPSYEEQRKIGSFFKQLDDTITLHQRKLDLLKEQKKGFLQKMFI
ncbi:restriction endonuclease subunit S [Enterococcus lactis]|uniref:restriction endonuclease subunit S n=2 Tax=Enterococcus TaxID=1350 RepID=UPI001C7CC2EC|nr:restriction endonuclease subunit S [Enterococcus lactis]EIB6830826.1 restriction endonuclease subunit S [Enterococcus faecalis]MBX4207216.1 restriction endonuclease subunit S [Enterococcus lactis]MBX4239432.1 restriction endonuclease subunit S [Enterococcus lactis]MBX4248286.1 restriction endonuclease subunit S [Enterococcus lactis]